jgi:hypothetical protein
LYIEACQTQDGEGLRGFDQLFLFCFMTTSLKKGNFLPLFVMKGGDFMKSMINWKRAAYIGTVGVIL